MTTGAFRVSALVWEYERPGRLVLAVIGALFNRMAPVLWVIAVLSTLTVIHRMLYTWTRIKTGNPLPRRRGGPHTPWRL